VAIFCAVLRHGFLPLFKYLEHDDFAFFLGKCEVFRGGVFVTGNWGGIELLRIGRTLAQPVAHEAGPAARKVFLINRDADWAIPSMFRPLLVGIGGYDGSQTVNATTGPVPVGR
jgi:hypothetical protein